MTGCVFCRIIKDDLPAHVLYQDELLYCFLDIAPINPGHALLIPKEHHVSITTIPSVVLSRMMVLASSIAQSIVREVDADGFNLHLSNGQCAGQVVPHAHLHLIPRTGDDGFSWGWRTCNYASEEAKGELANQITQRLLKNNGIQD